MKRTRHRQLSKKPPLVPQRSLQVVIQNESESDITDLHKHLGALDVGDERDGVIDGHASCAVTLRHKRRRGPGPSVTHRQVDDEVELVVGKVVGDGALVDAVLFVRAFLARVLVRPVHRLHLQVPRHTYSQIRRVLQHHWVHYLTRSNKTAI